MRLKRDLKETNVEINECRAEERELLAWLRNEEGTIHLTKIVTQSFNSLIGHPQSMNFIF